MMDQAFKHDWHNEMLTCTVSCSVSSILPGKPDREGGNNCLNYLQGGTNTTEFVYLGPHSSDICLGKVKVKLAQLMLWFLARLLTIVDQRPFWISFVFITKHLIPFDKPKFFLQIKIKGSSFK